MQSKERESSSSREDKNKKAKKKRKKKKKAKENMLATKPAEALFSTTALDPRPEIRKKIRKEARKLGKKKEKKQESGSESGSEKSTSSGATHEEHGMHLFGEEAQVKRVWSRYPGALTLTQCRRSGWCYESGGQRLSYIADLVLKDVPVLHWTYAPTG